MDKSYHIDAGLRAAVARMSRAALEDELDALADSATAIDDDLWRFEIESERQAVLAELRRRDAEARPTNEATVARRQALKDVARRIREMVPMRDVLAIWGWVPTQTGRTEDHGPCPRCGGADRFILFHNPGQPERVWCRQCDLRGDAVQIYRDIEGVSFADAVTSLALDFGVPLPREIDERPLRPTLKQQKSPTYFSDLAKRIISDKEVK